MRCSPYLAEPIRSPAQARDDMQRRATRAALARQWDEAARLQHQVRQLDDLIERKAKHG